jgi:hypothetical protein
VRPCYAALCSMPIIRLATAPDCHYLRDFPLFFPRLSLKCRQDSDIIHLNVLGMSVIVLSSLGATETLLQKHSYSDRQFCLHYLSVNCALRPEQPMLIDLMGWGFNFASRRLVFGQGYPSHILQHSKDTVRTIWPMSLQLFTVQC